MMTATEKRLYMREWRKRHPGYNYSHVKAWNEKLKEKLGEDGFRAWLRDRYQKYRVRILKSEKLRKSKIDPEVARENRKQFWKKYKAKHDERIKADRRDYYARNRERTLARKQKNRDADLPATRAYWRKSAHLRRARKRGTTVGDRVAIDKVFKRRDWWRQWFPVEVDHIISLARGGKHEAKNLQIIYDFENRRKHARSDYKPRVVFV